MTSCGLNGGPLSGTGTYEARIACNLRGAKGTFAYVRLHHKEKDYPYFTQSGTDREQDGDQYIANMQDGAMAGFKYFLLAGENRITVSIRGKCSGRLIVYTENADMPAAEITVSCSEDWKSYTSGMTPLTGKQPLYFVFRGSGSLDFNSFTMEKYPKAL
jgi:arabinoxylan arabinofuranohydrolase